MGVYSFSNGNKYVGNHKDGKRHGTGTVKIDARGKELRKNELVIMSIASSYRNSRQYLRQFCLIGY